jgi:hypothetical protein
MEGRAMGEDRKGNGGMDWLEAELADALAMVFAAVRAAALLSTGFRPDVQVRPMIWRLI